VRRNDAVYAAAVSPDGKRMALGAKWGSGSPHLVLASWNGKSLSSPRQFRRIRACELSWRPDGGELALVQRLDACGGDEGQIVRVEPGTANTVPLTTAGEEAGSPTWLPADAR